jgi:hypothetical protein
VVNFSDTLFYFEKFARNVAGYGNFEKNYKSLGTWQVSEIYEKKYKFQKRGRFWKL